MLEGVGDGFGSEEIGVDLDVRCATRQRIGAQLDNDGDARPATDPEQRRSQTPVAQNRREQRRAGAAQLVEDTIDDLGHSGQFCSGLDVVADPIRKDAQLHAQHDELLLNAVVQILRDALAFTVLSGYDPPRGAFQFVGLTSDDTQLIVETSPHALERPRQPADFASTIAATERTVELAVCDRRGGVGQVA